MKPAKILFFCMLLLSLCLLLAACGRTSKAYENLNSRIEQFRDPEFDKWRALDVQRDYEALSEEDRAKIESYDLIEDALAVIRRIEPLQGDWVMERVGVDEPLTFNIDSNGYMEWKHVGSHVWLDGDTLLHGSRPLGTLVEEDGFQKILIQSDPNSILFVKDCDADAARAKKYVVLNSGETPAEEIFAQSQLVALADEDRIDGMYVFALPSLLYEKGLVMIGASDDFQVTYEWSVKSTGETYEFSRSGPFDFFATMSSDCPAVLTPLRWEGSLYFIRAEYIASNTYYETVDVAHRTLTEKCGASYSRVVSSWYSYYPLFPY